MPMKTILTNLYLPFFLLLLTTCVEREWDNPYDPNCSAEKYTPSAFSINQLNENSIELKWGIGDNRIEGFYIERKKDDDRWNRISQLIDKEETSWIDADFQPGTSYLYRIFAKAGNNVSEFNTASITTSLVAPEVMIISIQELSSTSIKCICKVNNTGGGSITNCGITWETYRGYLEKQNVTSLNNEINFTVVIKDLEPGIVYSIKGYAINDNKTGYSKSKSVILDDITGQEGTFTDIDGNVYKWIGIGNQAWMVENLKVTKLPNGDPIPHITDGGQWANASLAYCFYNNDPENSYGALYNWQTAKAACPEGWHLPTWQEIRKLEYFIMNSGYMENVAYALKSTQGWMDNSNGIDKFELSCLPAGCRWGSTLNDGEFESKGKYCNWWTASYDDYSEGPTHWMIRWDNDSPLLRNNYPSMGYSVRCVRN